MHLLSLSLSAVSGPRPVVSGVGCKSRLGPVVNGLCPSVNRHGQAVGGHCSVESGPGIQFYKGERERGGGTMKQCNVRTPTSFLYSCVFSLSLSLPSFMHDTIQQTINATTFREH